MIGILCVMILSGCGINAVVDERGNRHSVSSFFAAKGIEEGEDVLVAKLTGSIYETGDYITVFGTCLTARDQPVNASVSLTVYYPNGTLAIQTTNVSVIKLGYWYYSGVMGPTIGTYLTIWNCTYRGQTALAYGEWQNPVWVNRLENISNMLANISVDVNITGNVSFSCADLGIDNTTLCDLVKKGLNDTNLTLQQIITKLDGLNLTLEQIYTLVYNNNVSLYQVIDMLTDINSTVVIGFYNTNQSFDIVFDKLDNINATIVNFFNNTNLNLSFGICIANHSVDRNDSYLARLSQSIARAVGAPISGAMEFTELNQIPILRVNWRIRAYVEDEYGNWGDYENGVRCNITIYEFGNVTEYNYTWVNGRNHPLYTGENCPGKPACTDSMIVKGFFEFEHVFFDVNGNWTTHCFYDYPVYNLTGYTYPSC